MSKLKPMDTAAGEDPPRVWVVCPDDELEDATITDADPADETDDAGQLRIVPPFGPWPKTGGLESLVGGLAIALVAFTACGDGPTRPEQPPDNPMYPSVQAQLIVSGNELGVSSYTVDLEPMPIKVWGGREDLVLHQVIGVDLPDGIEITAVTTFIGIDPGDQVEADAELWTSDGVFVYARSEHRPMTEGFNAWDDLWTFPADARPRANRLEVTILGRVTGPQLQRGSGRFGELSARIHWGVRFHGIRD